MEKTFFYVGISILPVLINTNETCYITKLPQTTNYDPKMMFQTPKQCKRKPNAFRPKRMLMWRYESPKSLEELILYSDNSLEGNDLCSASYISVCLQQLWNEEWKLQLFMKSIHIRAYHWGAFKQCIQRPPDLECWISHCNVISGIKKIINNRCHHRP